MKRWFCLILALLALSGCALHTSGGTTVPATPGAATSPSDTPPSATSIATDPVLPVLTVTFSRQSQENLEYARITAVDDEGTVVWTVETKRYDVAQMDRVLPIGQWQQQYYFVDDGDIVALDVQTGGENWRNPDFGGVPAGPDACHITADGTVYLCGFFGPDFYAVDAKGSSIARISELEPEYYWAHRLIVEQNRILVCFSGGPEGDMGPEAYKFPLEFE